MNKPNDKTKDAENPVGPEGPLLKLDIPMWQVYLGLFLIALVLTAFKLYERSYIAPGKEVRWQQLDIDEFTEKRRQRSDLLIWIRSSEPAANESISALFVEPKVRAAVYLNRFLAYEIKFEHRNEELNTWVEQNLKPISSGGIACWMAGQKKPVLLTLDELDAGSLVDTLEGLEQDP